MASPDYAGDINRIIEILKADDIIFDKDNPDGKLREIYFGEDSYEKHDQAMPYALVTTTNSPFLTNDQFGIGDGSSDPQITVQYSVKVFTQNGRPQKSEELLYGFVNKIVTRLKANPRLKEPAGLTDPKCIRSLILQIAPNTEQRGKEIQGAEIIIQCQIGSHFTIDIAGFTGIPLISKPTENETEITENIYNKSRIRKHVAPITETHSFFTEMEFVETIVATLRTTKRNRAIITTTLHRPGGSTAYNGKIVDISNGASFDQLETVVIRFEIIH